MNSMESDINLLLFNLKNLRKNNKGLNNKLVDKAEKIKQLQARSDHLAKMVNAITSLKLLSSYPLQIRNTFSKDKVLAVKYFK